MIGSVSTLALRVLIHKSKTLVDVAIQIRSLFNASLSSIKLLKFAVRTSLFLQMSQEEK